MKICPLLPWSRPWPFPSTGTANADVRARLQAQNRAPSCPKRRSPVTHGSLKGDDTPSGERGGAGWRLPGDERAGR